MDGVVEGTIALPDRSRLTLGPNARVLADISAGDVVIYGHVEGNIHASGRIELRDSSVVKGDIVAGRLSIEENASIKGKVELSETAAKVSSAPETGTGLFGASAPASTIASAERRSRGMVSFLEAKTRLVAARQLTNASRGIPADGGNSWNGCVARNLCAFWILAQLLQRILTSSQPLDTASTWRTS